MLKQESGLVFIETQGYSMWPFLSTGEKLIVKKVPVDALCPKDLVLYRQGDKYICHRLIKKSTTLCYLRGDSAWGSPEEIEFGMVIGKVIGILKADNKMINMVSIYQRILNQMRILALPFLYLMNKVYMICLINRRDIIKKH